MQNQDQNSIYRVVKDYIPKSVLSNKNKAHTWQYGYNKKHDVVVISKNGTVGEVYDINGVKIAFRKAKERI